MTLHIEHVPVDRIKPAVYNPRQDLQPGDPQYDRLRRSLETFGYVEPIVWNRQTGHLVGGHQRFKVLQEQGQAEITVSVVDLSLAQEKALNVALNKIQGDWDESKLATLLEDLSGLPEFDVSLTGFDCSEIGALFDRLSRLEPGGEDGFDLADDLESARHRPAITQRGELLELGPHRLLCGDTAKADDLVHLLDGVQPELVFTDPPYNVAYYGGQRPTPQKARPKRSRTWERIYMDNLSQEEYESWFGKVIGHLLKRIAPGIPLYIWNGHRQFGPMQEMLRAAGVHVSCVITWAKENFAIGYGDYNQQTEFCLYGWKASANAEGAPHRWFGPTNETTLWQIHRDHTRAYRHPTQKPIALAERAITNSSGRGDAVLDVFLGSGSTLIAADRLQRRCFGMEIDPHYCDAIVRRYLAWVDDANRPEDLVARYGVEVRP